MIFNNSTTTNISRLLKGQVWFIHIKLGLLLLIISAYNIRGITNNVMRLIFGLDIAIPSFVKGISSHENWRHRISIKKTAWHIPFSDFVPVRLEIRKFWILRSKFAFTTNAKECRWGRDLHGNTPSLFIPTKVFQHGKKNTSNSSANLLPCLYWILSPGKHK